MTNFNKRICFNINVPVCPTYGTRFKDLCLSFFSPLSPATPLCCSEPASRCRTESGVHHCACPPWGNTIFLRVPRWVPALSQFCDKNERSDLVSYGCPCWICLILLVWQKAEFMWRVLFFFFSPVVKTLEDSHLYPAVCLFEVSGNTLSLRLVNVSKIWSELDNGRWGYSGRLDSLTCTYAMWSHTAPFCRKTGGKALRAVLHYFFLLSTIFNIFFHCKAMALVLRCNSERPLFVWSCCSEERSTQWPTAVLCTKHSC